MLLRIGTWKVFVVATTVILVSIIGSVQSTNFTSRSDTISSSNSPLNSPEFVKKAGQFASRMLLMYNHKTHRRSFMFPPKTILTLTPKITFPVFKQKSTKGGLQSDLQASMVFYMKLDELGMTTPGHMFPMDIPPFYPFGDHMPTGGGGGDEKEEKVNKQKPGKHPYMMNKDGEPKPFPFIKEGDDDDEEGRNKNRESALPIFGKRQGTTGKSHRVPRSVMSLPPPESIHGGERAIILPSIESHLTSFGFDSGRACMLRAICEVHELPLSKIGYGIIGEMVTLLFSVSESDYAETHMPEYLQAEMNGKLGDCSSYYKNCTKSIFKWEPRDSGRDDLTANENEL